MKNYHKNLEILKSQVQHIDTEFDENNEFSKISEEDAENLATELLGIANPNKVNLERKNYLKIYDKVGLYGIPKLKSLSDLEFSELNKFAEVKRQNLAYDCKNRALHSDNFEYPKEFENDWIGYWKSINPDYQKAVKISEVINEYLGKDRAKELKLTNPAIALFCQIVNESIESRGNKNIEIFVKEICKKYGLTYNDKVRQSFSQPMNDFSNEAKKIVKDLIFPNIPESDLNKIKANNNLYG